MKKRISSKLTKAEYEMVKAEVRADEAVKKEKEKAAQKAKMPTGVFLDEVSGSYGFRLGVLGADGKKKDTKRIGFKTSAQAKKAREELRYEIKHAVPVPDTSEKDYSKTFAEVYEHYLEHRAIEKRAGTLRKQSSLWENHIKDAFGNRKLADVSKADLYNYLLKMYTEGDDYSRYKQHETGGYSYAYVEGFLKFFWLIYGYAYDNNWVDTERFNKDFMNKTTKLTMPKKVDDEDLDDIRIYSAEELAQIEEIMKTGSMYLAYLIALHCGLRISEIMGLRWSDIDWTERKIAVRRQMLYDYKDSVFYLGPPKTKNGRRDVYMSDKLYDYLVEHKTKQEENSKSKGYRNTEVVYDRVGKDKDEPIQGGNFLHRKENGELLTTNSVKYWTDKVKKETGIGFHFHALRHTNASILAANNIPLSALVEHLGHGNANVAMQYYVASTTSVNERIKATLNTIA